MSCQVTCDLVQVTCSGCGQGIKDAYSFSLICENLCTTWFHLRASGKCLYRFNYARSGVKEIDDTIRKRIRSTGRFPPLENVPFHLLKIPKCDCGSKFIGIKHQHNLKYDTSFDDLVDYSKDRRMIRKFIEKVLFEAWISKEGYRRSPYAGRDTNKTIFKSLKKSSLQELIQLPVHNAVLYLVPQIPWVYRHLHAPNIKPTVEYLISIKKFRISAMSDIKKLVSPDVASLINERIEDADMSGERIN